MGHRVGEGQRCRAHISVRVVGVGVHGRDGAGDSAGHHGGVRVVGDGQRGDLAFIKVVAGVRSTHRGRGSEVVRVRPCHGVGQPGIEHEVVLEEHIIRIPGGGVAIRGRGGLGVKLDAGCVAGSFRRDHHRVRRVVNEGELPDPPVGLRRARPDIVLGRLAVRERHGTHRAREQKTARVNVRGRGGGGGQVDRRPALCGV
mmetsp:Transcript_42482/g.102305  ORF Transcript_42482/g.102305 Transcript_42482/m.102305 type:complete len:200 (+) Transcript_42482:275-874(+)